MDWIFEEITRHPTTVLRHFLVLPTTLCRHVSWNGCWHRLTFVLSWPSPRSRVARSCAQRQPQLDAVSQAVNAVIFQLFSKLVLAEISIWMFQLRCWHSVFRQNFSGLRFCYIIWGRPFIGLIWYKSNRRWFSRHDPFPKEEQQWHLVTW